MACINFRGASEGSIKAELGGDSKCSTVTSLALWLRRTPHSSNSHSEYGSSCGVRALYLHKLTTNSRVVTSIKRSTVDKTISFLLRFYFYLHFSIFCVCKLLYWTSLGAFHREQKTCSVGCVRPAAAHVVHGNLFYFGSFDCIADIKVQIIIKKYD